MKRCSECGCEKFVSVELERHYFLRDSDGTWLGRHPDREPEEVEGRQEWLCDNCEASFASWGDIPDVTSEP
jgi:hypothetical protein